ncbi:hypothetical protein GCM10017083_12450 [Thalassobaculum fulvum]|uniref:Aminoglycoside phosphotransferase family enzyme n=1 Tax=Thalassobaculum fulvum TaxID=1633335 RepID=A0A918XQY1_9PROT|nr:hypothetical protein [Thalassobaculum fulvum]GHD44712.1 hypothetical protein GCM10017083_12450 [Thalassobaculum fulvum]
MTVADTMSLADKVAFLSQQSAYPGETGPVETKETHMSWVFLTDRHAYKMKKPMRQERLDFGTLERRRFFCEEEVRLNRRLAPDVYLATLPLTVADDGAPAVGGDGAVVEWLVKMRRLPAAGTLEAMALAGRLRGDHVEAVAERMARFYAGCVPERIADRDYRRRFRRALADTQCELRRPEFAMPLHVVDRAVDRLARFVDVEGARLNARVWEERIVEGHGDLRPEHIYLEPTLLVTDCLEFDRSLRLVDPADELGYLAMECEHIGATHVHDWLFDAYAEITGDRPTDDLLGFYKGCRALHRAKLSIWHLNEPDCRRPDHWRDRARGYLEQAAIAAERLL